MKAAPCTTDVVAGVMLDRPRVGPRRRRHLEGHRLRVVGSSLSPTMLASSPPYNSVWCRPPGPRCRCCRSAPARRPPPARWSSRSRHSARYPARRSTMMRAQFCPDPTAPALDHIVGEVEGSALHHRRRRRRDAVDHPRSGRGGAVTSKVTDSASLASTLSPTMLCQSPLRQSAGADRQARSVDAAVQRLYGRRRLWDGRRRIWNGWRPRALNPQNKHVRAGADSAAKWS